MHKGLFVVFEGVDGAGTTTQVQAVADRLRQRGLRVHTTAEPSEGPIGLFLRQILTRSLVDENGHPYPFDFRTMALLFAADRTDHIAREVAVALEQGAIVISDRYSLSSLVYQSATSNEPAQALEFVRSVNCGALPPDLVCVFDVDPSVAAARRAARGGPEELFEKAELQRRLSSLYQSAEELDPGAPIVHVDAELPIFDLCERLFLLVLDALASRHGRGRSPGEHR